MMTMFSALAGVGQAAARRARRFEQLAQAARPRTTPDWQQHVVVDPLSVPATAPVCELAPARSMAVRPGL
jgi:hypothetical protein